MTNPYPKGAEWRKWDLHVHTPSSYDYEDKSVNNDDIIRVMSENNISLIAVTDHHYIDIARIQKLQELGRNKDITVLPGIEFLSDSRGKEPIHFIAVFPEDCNLSYTWAQIENNTQIKAIKGKSKKINEIYCNLADTTKLIHELGGIVTIHAGTKSNGIDNITNSLPHSVAQKIDIAELIDVFELGKEKDIADYKKIVVPLLQNNIDKTHPLILCTDNHNIRNYKIKQNCWIKADPTFEGLKQILNEPEDRVFIGEKPPIFTRVENNRTKYISELNISAEPGYDDIHGKWFKDVSIPLNKELVAIIGHKGSGKSAVADIISLCANYHDDSNFSFLTSKKFREKKGKIAKYFNASLVWESGYKSEKKLNDPIDKNIEAGIKYLPQGQFERLTNEIRTATEFQEEIEKVVFSHIDYANRLDTDSFSELIDNKKSTIETELTSLFDAIKSSNSIILKLEQKNTEEYKSKIKNKYDKKKDELAALTEPPLVSDPNDDPKKKKRNETIISNIDKLTKEIKTLENKKKDAEKNKKTAFLDINILTDSKKEIQIKAEEIDRFISEQTQKLLNFDLTLDNIISLNIDYSELDKLIITKEKSLEKIQYAIGDEELDNNSESFFNKIAQKRKDLKAEQEKLDTEQRKHQSYLMSKDIWEKEKEKIIGDKETSETIEYYKNEINYLDNTIKTEIGQEYEKRENISRNIFKKKQEVITIYKDIKSSINQIIENNSDNLKDYKIEITASLVKKTDFNDKFFSFINHKSSGSYYSTAGAEEKFSEIITDVDFDDEESVVSLLNRIKDSLHNDERSGQNNQERSVEKQAKDAKGLYSYLFNLEFIDYHYQLKQGGKGIEQLSPGERGALLLIFYLLLDKNDKPLIIDQPEDNLDNHSVATILVPFIRAAKAKRQIIMVTHNPNLAVVADAEQIIYVNLDKENNYTFSTVTGSIENKDVNNKIVEVLEGTMPAFNKRKNKYYENNNKSTNPANQDKTSKPKST